MVSFAYSRAATVEEAVRTRARHTSDGAEAVAADFFAGGTDMLQLMRESVRNPKQIVDITGIPGLGDIELRSGLLHMGALVHMSDAAAHPLVSQNFPVISEALLSSASPQVRNLATLGGNILQRTRCGYFRDVVSPCNKRIPGSGCPATEGQNRLHAILGTSEHCIATYASDFAHALIVLNAELEISGTRGNRTIPFAKLHRQPGDAPHIETELLAGEFIKAIIVPVSGAARRSHYLKVRDRTTFEWAIASSAIALDLDDSKTVRDVRISVGGVATVPWRLPKAEAFLTGKILTSEICVDAGSFASEGAVIRGQNAYKKVLIERTVTRALAQTGGLE